LGLIYATLPPRVNGIVLGLSLVVQLIKKMDFWRNLDVFDYGDVWEVEKLYKINMNVILPEFATLRSNFREVIVHGF